MLDKKNIEIALSKEVRATAFKVALVVGTMLGIINHGHEFLNGTLTISAICQILITYCIPYSTSTYSSVKTYKKIKCIDCERNDKQRQSDPLERSFN